MRTISVVGIGAGNPEQITVQAIRTLNEADVVFWMDKGDVKHGLADAREQICARYITGSAYRIVTATDPERDRSAAGYAAAVDQWRAKRADIYQRLITEELAADGHGAFLAWGDPGIYDSIVHVLREVLARGTARFELRVIPGISSVQALAAGFGISLTRTGRPLQITTGRRLDTEGFPADADDVVVMLDARNAFSGIAEDTEIYWGAYLGTQAEILIHGRVKDVAGQIASAREEARQRHGWIMDTYLLRRPDEGQGRPGEGRGRPDEGPDGG